MFLQQMYFYAPAENDNVDFKSWDDMQFFLKQL